MNDSIKFYQNVKNRTLSKNLRRVYYNNTNLQLILITLLLIFTKIN